MAICLAVACGEDGDIDNLQEPTPDVAPTLTVTPATIEAGLEGVEQVLTIATDASSWRATMDTNVSWARITVAVGLRGETKSKVIIDANRGEPRQTVIIFSAPDCEDVNVTLSQQGVSDEDFYGGALYVAPDSSNMGDMNSAEFAVALGVAWNLGNTLEALGGETAWGNPKTTPEIIALVKQAGFKTIRIPVSWLVYDDGQGGDYHIPTTWLDRVEEVVNYCLDEDMYVIINEHYDAGLFNDLSAAAREQQLRRAEVMWRQIAIRFRDYDARLIFAGFNENHHAANSSLNGTAEVYETQNQLVDCFVRSVRATGGRNAYRYLAVQPCETNIPSRLPHLRLPEDEVNRLLVECHCYTPYAFTLAGSFEAWMGSQEVMYLWSHYLSDQSNPYYMDAEIRNEIAAFGAWCRQHNVGGLLGEFGTTGRYDIASAAGKLQEHYESRAYWNYVVANECALQGICPMLWDNGDATPNGGGVINRRQLRVEYPSIINAIMDGFHDRGFEYRE